MHIIHYSFLVALSIIFAGCVPYSTTTHHSIYHGSDDHAGLGNFHYIKYGISGSASAEYDITGGGDVREGLLAEAKRNLMNQFPLGPNQAYANVSIDDLHTTLGVQTASGVRSASAVVITVVMSADIIQYGITPSDYTLPLLKNSNSLIHINPETDTRNGYSFLNDEIEYALTELVLVIVDGDTLKGQVKKKFSDPTGNEYKVQYEANGRSKSGFFYTDEMIKYQE